MKWNRQCVSILQCKRCESTPQIVESDHGNTCPVQNIVEHIVHTIRQDAVAVRGREYILVIGFGFLDLQDFYRLRRDRQRAVGVLRFQWGFYDLTDPL